MATCQVQDIYDDVRGILSDNNNVPTGELFPNSYFTTNKNAFGEPYRSMFSKITGGSKRVQRVVYLVLPANFNVLIPSTYGIVDFSEPEMIEERQATNSIAITGTDTGTPIIVTCPSHGLGPTGSIAQGAVSGIIGTTAPWGNWFVTVIDGNTFSLNGSASDGIPGTAGTNSFFYPASTQQFSEVQPLDLSDQGFDGQINSVLGVFLWINEMIQFRGCTNAVELRITYYASGTAPTNPNYVINIDNCRDFLATATASNCARAKQWFTMAETLRNKAYGDPSHPEEVSLIDLFYQSQVLALQRGPARHQLPFRDRRARYGTLL